MPAVAPAHKTRTTGVRHSGALVTTETEPGERLSRLPRRLPASLAAESATPVIVGLVACALGFLLIAWGWSQIALRKSVAAQVPWVVSAGFTGLGLIIVGALAAATQVRRRDAERQLQRLERLVAAARDRETASL